jgi:hypothetical protein
VGEGPEAYARWKRTAYLGEAMSDEGMEALLDRLSERPGPS